MAELTTLARPYAKAAFEYALEHQDLSGWAQALQLLGSLTVQPEMRSLLASPSLTAAQKSQLFVDICGDALSQTQSQFVGIVAENKRLGLLVEISTLFDLYKSNQEKAINVEVLTAYELDETLTATLKNTLSQKLDRDVTLNTSVDRQLLGGALIRAGDTVIDGSVRGRLAKLAEAMNA